MYIREEEELRAGKDIDSNMALTRDTRFFMAPQLTFIVEQTIFRIPREWMEQSEVFTTLYMSPEAVDGSEGDELQNVTADEFRAFLELLIPLPTLEPKPPLSNTDVENALRLSTRWNFESVKLTCIKLLEQANLEPAEKIHLAHLYDIPHWLAPEIERLARRRESLTVKEAKLVGLETLMQIAYYRDMRYDNLVKVSEREGLDDINEEADLMTSVGVSEDLIQRYDNAAPRSQMGEEHIMLELEEKRKRDSIALQERQQKRDKGLKEAAESAEEMCRLERDITIKRLRVALDERITKRKEAEDKFQRDAENCRATGGWGFSGFEPTKISAREWVDADASVLRLQAELDEVIAASKPQDEAHSDVVESTPVDPVDSVPEDTSTTATLVTTTLPGLKTKKGRKGKLI